MNRNTNHLRIKAVVSLALMGLVALSAFFRWISILGLKISPLNMAKISQLARWAGESGYAFLGTASIIIAICMAVSAGIVCCRRYLGKKNNGIMPAILSAVLSVISLAAGGGRVCGWAVIIPLAAVVSNLLWKNVEGRETPFWNKICSFSDKFSENVDNGLNKGTIRVEPVNRASCNEYVFVPCRSCQHNLRLPAHKGMLEVRCPACRYSFRYYSV